MLRYVCERLHHSFSVSCSHYFTEKHAEKEHLGLSLKEATALPTKQDKSLKSTLKDLNIKNIKTYNIKTSKVTQV